MSAPKFRPLRFGVTRVTLKDGVPGTHYLKADQDLQAFPDRLTDRLQHWAQKKPTQKNPPIFLGKNVFFGTVFAITIKGFWSKKFFWFFCV